MIQGETRQEHINIMQAMCAALNSDESGLVRKAWVHAWGRYTDFEVRVTPMQYDGMTTRRLKTLVAKCTPKGVILKARVTPTPQHADYWENGKLTKRIASYSPEYWTFHYQFPIYSVIAEPLLANLTRTRNK